MSEDLVLVDTSRPHIRLITMNRPDKRNALNIPLLEAFCHAVDEANHDADTRVIVITGAGPVFCAGLDLTEARDTAKSHQSGELVGKALKAIMSSPHTTIAAARGAAIAGGAGFMLACDLSVVADDFRVGFVEVRRGLVAAFVMTFLRRKVGEPKAREMLLLGELMNAEEAKAAGLVNRVVSAERIMGEAFAFAYAALKGAPMAIRRTKKLFDELYHLPVSEHIDHANEFHKDMRTTEEAKEGLAAYAEKRLPKWDPEAEGKV
ncbi:MAG: enoyl-CoA hydratase/isomerase family protein [Candidatus Hydrogenedentes bacterium]|nr:enoyl-CoA hydratase/isomerase family protein [Candidatus Hydrogenedentota bacterium]